MASGSDGFDAAIRYADAWLAEQFRLHPGLPGLSVAIARRGEIAFNRQFGVARLGGDPLTGRHLFRIASHSKTFAAMAVGRLMDAGALGLDTPVADHVPAVGDNPDPRVRGITVGDCLAHASGSIRDGEAPDYWVLNRPFPDRAALLDHYAKSPLVIDPRTRLKYSNYAFGLVGQVVEAITGRPYNDFVREMLQGGVGRGDIGPEYEPSAGVYVFGHAAPFANEPVTPLSPAIDTAALSPATGFYATAEALALAYGALIDGSGRLVSPQTVDALLTEQWPLPDDPADRSYAYGFIQRPLEGRRLFGHSGSFPGQLSVTLFDRDAGVVVSVLTNSYAVAPDMLIAGVWQILDRFERGWTPGQNPGQTQGYLGRVYRPAGPTDLVLLGDRLYMIDPRQAKPFEPVSIAERIAEDRFRTVRDVGFGQFGEAVTLFRDGDGRVTGASAAGIPLLSEEEMRARLRRIAADRV